MSNFAETATLTADPHLRYTPTGRAVTEMRLAIHSGYHSTEGAWVDNETTWLDGQLWRGAVNAAESLGKGMRVIVRGNLRTRSWDREDGTKAYKTYLEITAIGPDLTFATAKVTKVQREQPAATDAS